ncbi:MAG TPA: outer membrane lipoprotein-sorting protein [Candidatus Manganitrophaceae bacterium]|nr:outer membrane lipoprotein-sorting protein [Candidatus Manganitrophaceae bacterium]
MLQKTALTLAITFLLLLPPLLGGEEAPKPRPTAEAILKAANKRIYNLKDQTADVAFRVVDDKGSEKKTLFKLYWKNYGGQDNLNTKTLLITQSPSRDKGQKFLIWEYIEEGQADLWLYLPELRQVRRIQPGRNRHEEEPDSDLLFEDMHQRRVEKDDHLLLPDDEVRGEPCYVIENRLKGKTLYSKTITFVSKNDGTIRRVDSFSPEGTLIKTQWIDWQQIDQSFVWKSSEIFNALSSRKTFVEVTNVKINTQLPEETFSERTLRK